MPEVLEEFGQKTGSYLTQTRVLGILRERMDEDAIIVGASGSLPGDLQRMWKSEVMETYHVEYGFSCMGYEVAATLGVKLAEPEHEVYCVVGDSSFQMLHSEIMTIVQEKQKVNI